MQSINSLNFKSFLGIYIINATKSAIAEPRARDILTDEFPKASFREIPLPSKYSPV